MKKYKLIKEYPGSPTLGTERESYELYAAYPEFWQEIVDYNLTKGITSFRRQDGQIFTIGDMVKTKQGRIYTLSGFVFNTNIPKDIVCITTIEKNKFKDEEINLDSLTLCDKGSLLTRECLSITDYLNVLQERDKKFLFAPAMIKYLKMKVHGKGSR